MSSLRGPLGACWGSGRLPPPGKNESPAQYGAFRCFRLVRRTLTVHERGEIGCQRGEQDNQEKADEQGDDERNGGAVHGAERHARHFLHDEEADAERRRDGGHVVQNRDDDAEPDQIPAENLRNGHEDRHADEQQRHGRQETAEDAEGHDDGEQDQHGGDVQRGDAVGEHHRDARHGHEVAEHDGPAQDGEAHGDELGRIVQGGDDVFPVHAAHTEREQQRAERPDAAALGRREHAAVNAADDEEEDAHDGQPRLERGHPLVEGGFGQPRGEARLEEDHEPHRGHEAQRAEEAGDDPRGEQVADGLLRQHAVNDEGGARRDEAADGPRTGQRAHG